MTLNFGTMTHLCETCRIDGENVDCGGVTCRLRILEIEEREMKDGR